MLRIIGKKTVFFFENIIKNSLLSLIIKRNLNDTNFLIYLEDLEGGGK
jgi:hypothetical protein